MSAGKVASNWEHVQQAPPDPILGVAEAFKVDRNVSKLNLSVGAYRTADGKPLVLNVVRKAEQAIVNDPSVNKEYLPITGNADFCRLSRELAFGKDCKAVKEGRVVTVQALSGTGSLRVGCEFLGVHYRGPKILYVPNPTWGNHKSIGAKAGLQVKEYRYFKPATRGLDIQGLLADLEAAEPGAIVLLHACAHNPTGVDPTKQQWAQILNVVQRKRLLPFFDSAYQGFASGDLDADAYSLRLFTNAGIELLLAQSYAKNLGLYAERVGAFSCVCANAAVTPRVESQLKMVIRPMYSNPPCHGAAIAAKVLGTPALFKEWKEELQAMSFRIKDMRQALYDALVRDAVPGDWRFVLEQIGMFSYTGLTRPQCEILTREWHVFLTMDGRISMAGLNEVGCARLSAAIKDVLTRGPSSKL